jgi:hypothetical protein
MGKSLSGTPPHRKNAVYAAYGTILQNDGKKRFGGHALPFFFAI